MSNWNNEKGNLTLSTKIILQIITRIGVGPQKKMDKKMKPRYSESLWIIKVITSDSQCKKNSFLHFNMPIRAAIWKKTDNIGLKWKAYPCRTAGSNTSSGYGDDSKEWVQETAFFLVCQNYFSSRVSRITTGKVLCMKASRIVIIISKRTHKSP